MKTGSKNRKGKKIRYLAVCSLAVMLFGMTGCGKGSQQSEQPAEGQPAEGQMQSEQPAEGQPAEEQVQSEQPAEGQPAEEQVQSEQPVDGQAAEEQAQAEQQPAEKQSQAGQTTENQGQTNQAAAGQAEGSQTQTDTDAAQNKAGQADIGLEQAKNTALSHARMEASAVTFTKEKLDYDDGRQEYEIEFVTQDTKYEYEIKADDGTILKVSSEPVDQTNRNGQIQEGITLEEAKAAAVSYVGTDEKSVKFTKLERDYDDGVAEYEIEFFTDGKEYSLTIDASSGDVLEMEMEND